jgi:alpha-amylase
MGVLMQAFYWNAPIVEQKEHQWWQEVAARIPMLREAGFTALWLPPVSKGANIGGISMGYDPYDYYDLGEYNQRGTVPTLFGTKNDLLDLIDEAHSHDMQVYADMVLNHCSGADEQELNPLTGKMLWTKYTPASGKFARSWECFHPSPYRLRDEEPFDGMPDLCHHNPYVYGEILKLAKWLVDEIGFDGFRYDFVKGFGVWVIDGIQGLRYDKHDDKTNKPFKPVGIGECWDSTDAIDEWLNRVNATSENPVMAFDFPLRGRLKNLCDTHGFSLRNLPRPGTLLTSRPREAVTFVENHDIVRTHPIIHDKILAYAFILTHEGYPCVFWQDYYHWKLGMEGTPHGIAALVRAHEDYAGGLSSVLHIDNDLYIMQRSGWGEQKGLVFVLNNRGDKWNGGYVHTRWRNTTLEPVAYREHADGAPQTVVTDSAGGGEFWAAPRGFSVYVPRPA